MNAVGQSAVPALVLVLCVLLILDGPRLLGELRFFSSASLIDSSGSAAVPQDDAETPQLDTALRAIASRLPVRASCVIAVDSWRREYFRASYLLMPHDVWPAVLAPSSAPIPPLVLGVAMRVHGADCLLTLGRQAAPANLHPERFGEVTLYVAGTGGAT